MKTNLITRVFSRKVGKVMATSQKQTTKYCARCKQHLPLSEFSNNAHFTSGKSSYCRHCLSEYYKTRAQRKKANQVSSEAVVDLKDVNKIIKERRKALGLTQREVADKAGITYQTVLNFEKGKPITIASLNAISKVFGLKLVATAK